LLNLNFDERKVDPVPNISFQSTIITDINGNQINVQQEISYVKLKKLNPDFEEIQFFDEFIKKWR
jgi:hypothetical protein